MPQIKNFRELIVWKKSFDFALNIYHATEKFPAHERFGLTSQIRRASLSIPSNIAEGYCRNTRKDYVHFLDIAQGSSAEVETQVLFAKELQYLSTEKTKELLDKLLEIQKILQTIRKKLRNSNPAP